MIHAAILKQAKRISRFTPIPALIAGTTFLATVSRHAYPGDSTTLIAAAAGLIPPSEAMHPLYSMVARSIAAIDFFPLPLRLNLFSALCGTICATLLYHLTAKVIFFMASEDAGGSRQTYVPASYTLLREALPDAVAAYNEKMLRLAIAGGLTAATVLTFTLGAWSASTRSDAGIFHLLLALASLSAFPTYNHRMQVPRLLLSTLFFSLGLLDSAAFLILLPVYVYFIFKHLFFSPQRTFAGLAIITGSAATLLLSIYAFTQNTQEPVSLMLPSTLSTYVRGLSAHHYREIISFFPRSGWIHLVIQVGLPAIIILFSSQALFKDKKANNVIALSLMTIAAIPGLLALKISPALIYKSHLPCFGYAAIAAATGFSIAACLTTLCRDSAPASSALTREPEFSYKQSEKFARVLCGSLLPILAVLLLLMPWANYNLLNQRGGGFADKIAREMLNRMQSRTVLISNGLLDNHLLIQAHITREPFTLISLNPHPDMRELKKIANLIATSPIFEGLNHQRLENALSIGTVRFVMEWFAMDNEICDKAMVFATPVIWTACNYSTVPEGIAFRGFRPQSPPDYNALIEQNRSFHENTRTLFGGQKERSGYLSYLRSELIAKISFAANEFGVYLEEQKLYQESYQSYERATAIDPANASAAVNQYALACNFDIHPERIDLLKARATQSLAAYQNRNILNTKALMQRCGNIHQQAFYLAQAKIWSDRGALSLSQIKIQKAFVLSEQNSNDSYLSSAQIHLYAGDISQAEACYLAALEQNSANTDALAGLGALMIKQSKIPEAEEWLCKAEQAGLKAAAIQYQRIVLALMKSESDHALKLLETATQEEPNDLRYWTMLAELLLKRGDTLSVEFKILPKMQNALKNKDHFLVHTVRGFLLRQKGPGSYREARRSLLKALSLNASLIDVWQAVFEIDLAINNPAFTESDARNLLNLDPEHALANYLLGASLLARGALPQSEDFLRRSLENLPNSKAYNDLAENLRLQKKLADAEACARKALQLEPDLVPAHDTLACVLCDAGRFEEANQLAAHAVAAEPDRLIYQLTLLRTQVKMGDKQGALKLYAGIPEQDKNIPEELRQEFLAL